MGVWSCSYWNQYIFLAFGDRDIRLRRDTVSQAEPKLMPRGKQLLITAVNPLSKAPQRQGFALLSLFQEVFPGPAKALQTLVWWVLLCGDIATWWWLISPSVFFSKSFQLKKFVKRNTRHKTALTSSRQAAEGAGWAIMSMPHLVSLQTFAYKYVSRIKGLSPNPGPLQDASYLGWLLLSKSLV